MLLLLLLLLFSSSLWSSSSSSSSLMLFLEGRFILFHVHLDASRFRSGSVKEETPALHMTGVAFPNIPKPEKILIRAALDGVRARRSSTFSGRKWSGRPRRWTTIGTGALPTENTVNSAARLLLRCTGGRPQILPATLFCGEFGSYPRPSTTRDVIRRHGLLRRSGVAQCPALRADQR